MVNLGGGCNSFFQNKNSGTGYKYSYKKKIMFFFDNINVARNTSELIFATHEKRYACIWVSSTLKKVTPWWFKTLIFHFHPTPEMSVTNSRTVGTQVPKRRYRSPELLPRVPNRRGPELSRSRNVGNSVVSEIINLSGITRIAPTVDLHITKAFDDVKIYLTGFGFLERCHQDNQRREQQKQTGDTVFPAS